MSLLTHPYKVSPAYVADEADRRAASAQALVTRIEKLQKRMIGVVASAQLIAEDAADENFDVVSVELDLAARSLDETARDLSRDYLEPVKRLLRDEADGAEG